jgi:hypothetical protein
MATMTWIGCEFLLGKFIFPSTGIFDLCKFVQTEGDSSILATESTITTKPIFRRCDFDVTYISSTNATFDRCNLKIKAAL